MDTITAGTPATICYYTDTRAAVVTKVTRTTVTVVEVEVGEGRKGPGDWDTVWDGDTTKPIAGTERIFRLNKHGKYVSNGQRLVLGHSRSRRDWTF